MKKTTKIIIAVLSFLVMTIAYEYILKIWAETQQGATIRVDVIIVYPVIIGLSALIYYLLGKSNLKKVLYTVVGVILLVILAGIIKFNFSDSDIYYQNEKGEYVNDSGRKVEFIDENEDRKNDLCDEDGKRYKTAKDAKKAGLTEAEFGATYCPEYKMDPSWDKNKDGINDCYDDNSCSKNLDYMSPRKSDVDLLE